jgi:hypothetical protein
MASSARIRVEESVEQCLQDCLDCHAVCLQTITHCLQKGGPHAEARHIRLLQDCAEACQTAAGFMTRLSSLHPVICAAAAEIADSCAQSCDQFPDDPHMRTCAEICRTTAASCRRLASLQPA